MSLPENKIEFPDIKRALADAGLADNKDALAQCVEAFDQGEFTAGPDGNVDAWFALQRTKRAAMWGVKTDDTAADEEHATKFQTLKGQGELLAQYGPAKVKEIGDRIGARVGTLGSTIIKPRESTNPWKMPTDTPEAAAKAQAAIVDHIKRRGSAISASMAKSAGKRIDGSPLKA